MEKNVLTYDFYEGGDESKQTSNRKRQISTPDNFNSSKKIQNFDGPAAQYGAQAGMLSATHKVANPGEQAQQYRNSKSRKLYTSIGAYSQSQQDQGANENVPIINFTNGGQGVIVSQQHSIVTNQQKKVKNKMPPSNHSLDEQNVINFTQYQSMIQNGENVNDISVLSGTSQSMSFMQRNGAPNRAVHNSMMIESRGGIVKKKKKNDAPRGANGSVLTSNFTKIGNYVGTDEPHQFTQNQINFLNNAMPPSDEHSVTSALNMSKMPTKVNSSNTSVLIQQQKARPHSSFKAQTQKQINTYKQQLINVAAAQIRGQHLLIGATGMGIGNGNGKKNQHLFPYQNEENNRRVGRGSSGVNNTSNELVSKEQREMRTSSATAGNTNTEFTLLSESKNPNLTNQNILGNSGGFAIPPNSSLNFNLTAQSKGTGRKGNKISKRNITQATVTSGFNFNNNVMSSTNIENFDSMRSGLASSANGQGGYGINMFPANKYDQQQRTGSNSKKNNTMPYRNGSQTNNANNAQKTHQQSMQKFLQQQMTQYNTNSQQQSKKKSQKVQKTGTAHYIGQQQFSQNSQIGEFYSNKQSTQKITKKQIYNQNQLASDRLKIKEASRKSGTQTAIGTGGKNTVLNSSQIQIQGGQKQASSLSRSRAASHAQKGQAQNNSVSRVSGGNGSQVKALQSIQGQTGIIMAAISGTPGIQGNSKINLIGASNSNTGQRNYYSYANNTNTSNQQQNSSSRRNKMINQKPQIDFDNNSLVQFGQSFEMPAQIQVAEQALREMKMNLYRHGSGIINRPKSQNDAQSYFMQMDDVMSQEQPLSSQSRQGRCETSSPQVPDIEDINGTPQEESVQNVNQTLIGQSRSANGIDKEQFLSIVQQTFDKISSCLHPRIGSSLMQVRQMYDTYLDQLEISHQQELQRNSIEIQELQTCITEFQVINQQLEMQNKGSNDKLMHQLAKCMKENQTMKIQLQKQKEKFDKQQNHLDHLKNNIEQQRYMVQGDRDDPLNLDGSIDLPDNIEFQQQHVRIRDGEIIEKSRRRLDDLSEGDLSSIPSYDQLDGTGVNGARQGVPLLSMSAIADERTLAEDGQMIFDDNDGDIDMKELDIDEDQIPHTGQHSRRREIVDDQQSSYTSQIGSSSEATIDSDLLMTYQQALRQHGTTPGPGSSQEAGMLMFQKSSNRPCPQDKSPIKVPTLNFGKIQQDEQEQYEENDDYEKPPLQHFQKQPKIPPFKKPTIGGALGFNLDMGKLKGQQDYQDEFMEAAKDFSESWRELLKKDKRF